MFRDCSVSVHPDSFGSDHFPITIYIECSVTPPPYSVSHIDWTAVHNDLNSFLQENAHVSTASFEANFRSILQSHSCRVTVRSKDTPPWWNSTCAWLLGQKRRYLRLARSQLSRSLWILYRNFAARLRKYMKSQARAYWNALCECAESRRLFRIFKALHGRPSPTCSHLVLESDGRLIADGATQASLFAAHFGQTSVLPVLPYDLSGADAIWNRDFTATDFHAAIRNTKNTTPGEDRIPAMSYKGLTASSRASLLDLCNRLLHAGTAPRSWRTAVILPIWKPGKPKALITSYRPIALTAVGCKIMERMILKRILDWVIPRKCFHSRHFGFLPGRDCTKALSVLMADIRAARSQGKVVVAVKLDIHSAYDSVWRDGLIYKMAQLGILGDSAQWIANWLRNRRIKVRWRGGVSAPVESFRGLPQGSVLSPMLFMIYMWDFFEIFHSDVRVIVYADDIVIYCSDFNFQAIVRKLQETLWDIQNWCAYWHLDIRADKCSAICFSRSAALPDQNLRVHGMDIAWSLHMKVLGLVLSFNLTFRAHFQYLQQKCLKRLNVLKAFASPWKGVRSQQLLRLVNALIRSLLEYAAPIYSSACVTSLRSLDVLYNSALRLATGLPRWTPLFKLYRESGQTPLGIRRSYLVRASLIRCVCSVCISDVPFQVRWDTSYGEVTPSLLIEPSWPVGWIEDLVEIYVDNYPFQGRNLPSSIVRTAFTDCLSSQFSGFHIIATDASKDFHKTSIAAVDCTTGASRACLVHHLNSVFTAEVLALQLGVQMAPGVGNCILLSDSMSALRALRSVSQRSPAVILRLVLVLREVCPRLDRLVFLWVPAHVGIAANEQADSLAKFGPFATLPFEGISPEDLASHFKACMRDETEVWWTNCKYARDSQYLGHRIYCWARNRGEDRFLARLRTLSMPTEYRLFKLRLRSSPLCDICKAGLGTEYHYIFECRVFDAERALLSRHMNFDLERTSWNVFWCSMECNARILQVFLDLFLGSGRF